MLTAAGKSHRKLFAVKVGSVLVAVASWISAAPSLAATTLVHAAQSYGAKVSVGTTVKLGPIAPAILNPCTTNVDDTVSASATSVSDGVLVDTGVVSSVASSNAGTSTSSSDVMNINLLGGLITANEIKAVSSSSYIGKVLSSSAAGSEFIGLSVLGVPITATPKPNFTIPLPGIGQVVLNEQLFSSSADRTTLTVNMIDVQVTEANLLGYKVGSEIIVADALSQVRVVPGPAVMGGYADAPVLSVASGLVTSGPLVDVLIPCEGSGGVVSTDTIASTSIPNVLSTGTVTVTGVGNITESLVSDEATTTTASLNLLSGLVAATVIKATASGSTTDGETFDFTAGSTFGSITVAGHPEITVDVAPNTVVSIAGLGTLTLNEVIKTSDEIKTCPIKLVVTTAAVGLPVGAELKIGEADVQLHSATIP